MRQRKFSNHFIKKGRRVIKLDHFASDLRKLFGNVRIKALPNGYIITEQGKLFRFSGEQGFEGPREIIEILPTKNVAGYLQVSNPYTMKGAIPIHRIVALEFLERIDGKDFVDHIDGNKENNIIENLRWVTRSENMRSYYDNFYKKKECSTPAN